MTRASLAKPETLVVKFKELKDFLLQNHYKALLTYRLNPERFLLSRKGEG